MSAAPIVTILTGRPDSLEAVRWASWLSQQAELPIVVVHAFSDEPGAQRDEALARKRATHWLHEALDPCPSLPYDVRLVVAEGPLVEVVGAELRDGGILVSGSQAPAELLSWACRVRRCPVVLVPDCSADERHRDGPVPEPVQPAARVPA
jgi:hypothetical protein